MFGEWEIGQQPDPLRASWPLLGPGSNGVSAAKPLAEVPAAPKDMAIVAGTNDNSWSAGGPNSSFTADDLRALQPGQVLAATRFSDVDSSGALDTVMTLAEFDVIDCSRFGEATLVLRTRGCRCVLRTTVGLRTRPLAWNGSVGHVARLGVDVGQEVWIEVTWSSYVDSTNPRKQLKP